MLQHSIDFYGKYLVDSKEPFSFFRSDCFASATKYGKDLPN